MEDSIDSSSLYWVHREKYDDSTNTANMRPDSMLWASQELHLFIITDAGKPIYSRYGTVQTLSPILCTCVIILEHMKTLNESLNHFTAGNHTFVFLPKKPFIFIAVSKSSLPATFLFKQLNFLYTLFLSLFSEKFISKIAETHSCDFRQYAEGTRSAWDGVVNNMSQDPAFIFAPSIPVTYMSLELRQKLIHSTAFDRLPSCKLVMLMRRNRVLAVCNFNCDALSLRLIVDLMWTPAFQNEESWTIFFARNSSEQMHHLYFKNHEKSDYRIVMLCSDNKGFGAYHNFAVSMFKDLEENYFDEMAKPLVGAPDVFYFWTLNSITYGQVYVTDPCEKVFGFSGEVKNEFKFTKSTEEPKNEENNSIDQNNEKAENKDDDKTENSNVKTENKEKVENKDDEKTEIENSNEQTESNEKVENKDDEKTEIDNSNEQTENKEKVENKNNEKTEIENSNEQTENKEKVENKDDEKIDIENSNEHITSIENKENKDDENKDIEKDDSINETEIKTSETDDKNGEIIQNDKSDSITESTTNNNYINSVFSSTNNNVNQPNIFNNQIDNLDARNESYEKMQDLYRQLAKCYEMVQTNGVDGEYMFRGDKDVIVVFKSKDMEIYAVAKSDELQDQMVTEKLNELKAFVNANMNNLIMTERKFHVDKFG